MLQEFVIDISIHHAKSVSEHPTDAIDMVVTLCAEKECPVYLGQAERIYWPLPDPAAVSGTPTERLEAFRRVRDELRERIEELESSAM